MAHRADLLARVLCRSRRRQLDLDGGLGLVFSRRPAHAPPHDWGRTGAAGCRSEAGGRTSECALAEPRPAGAAGDRSGFLLWLDVVAFPQLDPILLFSELSFE